MSEKLSALSEKMQTGQAMDPAATHRCLTITYEWFEWRSRDRGSQGSVGELEKRR